jgi:hypothetical protein
MGKDNKMDSIKEIANKIYQICFDTDKDITGLSVENATFWARSNSIRHAHTIKAIVNHSDKTGNRSLKILNASGIACGHQDFSINSYLRNELNYDIEWVAFESPHSDHLAKRTFQKQVKKFGIELRLSDFNKTSIKDLYGKEQDYYDIVIFTEIAEHLDHTTLLKSLSALNRIIKKNGKMILTTPNLLSLPNRLRMFTGKGNVPYTGDGTTNMKKGLYGHIVYYDIRRLERILNDVGFKIIDSYTFSFGHGPKVRSRKQRILIKINNFFSLFIDNSQAHIFLTAEIAEPKKIPYAT